MQEIAALVHKLNKKTKEASFIQSVHSYFCSLQFWYMEPLLILKGPWVFLFWSFDNSTYSDVIAHFDLMGFYNLFVKCWILITLVISRKSTEYVPSRKKILFPLHLQPDCWNHSKTSVCIQYITFAGRLHREKVKRFKTESNSYFRVCIVQNYWLNINV